MSRRGYRRSSSGIFGKMFWVVVLLSLGLYWGYTRYFVFDPQRILDESVLKEKSFETNVVEIVSPKKGIKAYLFEDNTNPIVSISFMFKDAGLASDPDGEVGIANMAAALLSDGAGDLNAQQFKEELEKRAIGLSFSAGMDDFGGSLLTTSDNQKEAYALLKSALTAPRFDAEDVARVKKQLLIALKQQKEHPAGVLALDFAKEIYAGHPYSRNPVGIRNDIVSITPEKLKTFVKNHLTRNNLIVGIAGAVSEERAGVIVDEIFGELPANGRITFVREAKIDFDGREKNIPGKFPQAVSVFAAQGLARNDKDFYPLYIANHILGGAGLNSRLSLSAREDEGLTYNIYTYLSLMTRASLLKGGFSSTPENFARVQEIIRSEWNKMGQNGVTQKELDEAKNYLISSYNLRFASIADIADILVYMQKDNLGLDFLKKRNEYVKAVRLEDVNRVSKKFFSEKNLIFVTIGNLGAN